MKLQKPHKNSPQNTSKAAEAETKIHRGKLIYPE